GTYRVDSQTVFTADDSGDEDRPVVYRAKEKGSVIFDGGVRIDPSLFVPASEEVKAKLTDESARSNLMEADLNAAGCYDLDDSRNYGIGWQCYSYRQELYVDGERQTVARWPNSSYDSNLLLIGEDDVPYIQPPENRASLWSGEKIRMYGMPLYDYDSVNMSENALELDTEKSIVRITGSMHFPAQNARSAYFYYYNILSEIDIPGEYYWDVEAGKLYYYPDGDLGEHDISFSQFAGEWFLLSGASYLNFEGFVFENGRNSVFASNPQTAADHITIDGCVFRDNGGYAVRMSGSFITVKNCEIYNMGSGCIELTGGNLNDLVSNCSVITNNLIHDWSETYTVYNPGININGYGFTVSHNEMYGSPHEAIAYNCGGSTIEYNYIHDVCTETGDAGAVYAGRRWDWNGNIIRFNLIENVIDTVFGREPNGIYIDDCLSEQWCYGNILVNIAGWGFHIGGGKKIKAENNILVNINQSEFMTYDSRGVGNSFGHDFTVYPDGYMWRMITSVTDYLSDKQRFAVPLDLLLLEHTGLSHENNPDDPGVPAYGIVQGNIAFGTDGKVAGPSDAAIKHCTFEANIVYDSDPGFADCENGNYSLKEDSRVYRDIPGFIRIDLDSIGILK
ncbi:MAG: right-handed parallel beta-helix repeat-containing protein, partial [Clostridia bacterium]|nr:right-handed parallel beta-helix repeat-containing protein [Clostridia bacterium]